MTNKEKIQLCIDWVKRSAELAEYHLNDNEWEGVVHIIENYIIKDANEALQYLKNGIKQEESWTGES